MSSSSLSYHVQRQYNHRCIHPPPTLHRHFRRHRHCHSHRYNVHRYRNRHRCRNCRRHHQRHHHHHNQLKALSRHSRFSHVCPVLCHRLGHLWTPYLTSCEIAPLVWSSGGIPRGPPAVNVIYWHIPPTNGFVVHPSRSSCLSPTWQPFCLDTWCLAFFRVHVVFVCVAVPCYFPSWLISRIHRIN